ncbi:MAG: hypothetical protein EZS28_024704 [Streblomastix strix]|uniref:Uncharacterized protein n=1 Tax=Streblomastix strix TaxID=222440 RepID=A0A5J4VB81_9EUKA|nr:MAG: hypothetical protein EZS28_024704 [Streblomastix strix]
MEQTRALCGLSAQLQVLLDGLDNCERKLDAKIAGGLPCRTNKKDLVCFDEAHNDTAYEMRMSLKIRIQDEINWMNSECIIDALEQLHIDWHAIWKAIYEAGIKAACESKLCH